MQEFREVLNPPNPWLEERIEWLEEIPRARPRVLAESVKSLLVKNSSPDIPFTWSANPYRGCSHACAYCYARTSHEYIGFGAGTDFENILVYKENAEEVLRAEMMRRSWKGERVVFSGITDPYQPLESSLKLTRSCLKVCEETATPVTIITKGALVERDLGLLARIHRREDALLVVSIPFFNSSIARLMEPGAPSPRRRFEIIRKAADAGVPTAVAISPIIPGLNDMAVPDILRAARKNGARFAMHSLLRLPGNVESVFRSRLREKFPGRRSRILNQVEACRKGQTRPGGFHERMKGRGERWDIVEQLFTKLHDALGYEKWRGPERSSNFHRPLKEGQLPLL